MKDQAPAQQAPQLVLRDWDEIAAGFVGEQPTGSLVLGNGLSCSVWDGFAYSSLLETAGGVDHPLTAADKAIFAGLGTPNFESVLAALHNAIVITEARGEDPAPLNEHYQRIRRALIEAVKVVHVPWDFVGEASRKRIGTDMRAHKTVYALSYDLVTYWSVVATGVKEFIDYFFADGHSFDLTWLPPAGGRTRLLYPHGALHLVRRWSGPTAKLVNDGRHLLEQFGNESNAEPLFVSEGTSAQKRTAIRRSDYLTYAYEQLASDPGPFVLFGVGLSAEDAHIASALNRNDLSIAIAIHGADDEARLAKAAAFVQSLPRARLTFFRSDTHPLGDPALKAVEPEELVDEATIGEVLAALNEQEQELLGEAP